ncbi:hypothetical protein F8M41_002229 [Gigaspora margarita]|uniref:Uncharacterized protein n=1 Tax=Gigaspora margarita TaxID=4874 RepID=A0A8H4AYS1_GIGMA|nr:hypothetical protein F8M41_002229 [Gigaspora margarita]
MMANNEIKLLENLELQFCYVENEVQFEEKLKNFLSPVLKTFANSHEIVRKKNKITHLISLIKNIELKPVILKKRLFQIILELSQELNPKLVDLEILETKSFYYGPFDLSAHNTEEDNEYLKVIIIKFHEFNQLNQLDEWINEENIQEIENILEENVNKVRIFEENFLIISNLTNAF